MAITLDGLTLPQDLIWVDKYNFTGIRAQTEITLGGTPLIWEGEEQGRPITLAGTSEAGWIEKSDLDTLFSKTQTAGATYTLSYEGTSYTVRFRHEEAPVIEAEPTMPRPNAADTDYFHSLIIKLMEV